MVFLCLKLKAVAAYLHVEKIKQMEERQAQYTRSLKPPAMAMNRRNHDQRGEHRHYDGCMTTQGTVSTLLRSASFQSMRTVGKMCLDLAIGVLRALFEKAPVRQRRFGAKFAKRQLFFDTQIFLFRIQKVIFGIHTAVRQGFNVGFCQSKCSVVFSFGVFSRTFQVGQIDHCQRPDKHTNCLPVTFTRAKLVRPWKSPCRKSMGLVSSQCKELFWYKPWSREIPDCLHEIYHVIAPALSHSDHRLHADQRCKRIHNAHKFELPSRDCC